MSAPTNYWKLGLFVVVSFFATLGAAVYLGTRSLQKETVSYKSYFDEAVTGLDLGAPVKFRGVTVGNVNTIDVAPDRRHVQVTYDLGVEVLDQLGLASGAHGQTKISVPPDLRVQLGSTGITGVKYVQMDFFDVAGNPLPELPFPVPQNYIPATSSTLKNVEDSVVLAMRRAPEVMDELVHVLALARAMLEELDKKGLSEKALVTMGRTNELLSVLQTKVGQVQTEELSGSAQLALGNVNQGALRLQSLLDQVEKVFLVSAQRTSDSVGDMARNASGLGPDMESTLQGVAEAAEAIRRLADALEREPEMLIKGRATRSR